VIGFPLLSVGGSVCLRFDCEKCFHLALKIQSHHPKSYPRKRHWKCSYSLGYAVPNPSRSRCF